MVLPYRETSIRESRSLSLDFDHEPHFEIHVSGNPVKQSGTLKVYLLNLNRSPIKFLFLNRALESELFGPLLFPFFFLLF